MIKLLIEQGSEAWFQAKIGLITGTRFADIMYVNSKTDGYKKLVTRIAGEILSGEREETFTNAIMQRGIDLEPEAADVFAETFGVELEEVGMCLPDEDHDYANYIGVSPDRLMQSTGLEIKCPIITTHFKYMKDNRLPNEHKWQVQGSMYVTGFDTWVFMSYYPNLKPFLIEVKKDEEMHEKLQ